MAIRKRALRNKGGFTLMELMVVIVIIGILVGLAFPSISSLRGTKMGTAAREVSSTLNVARSEAIAQRTAVRFGVISQSSMFPDYAYKKYGLWTWDKADRVFKRTSQLSELPDGVIFDPTFGEYVKDAEYVQKDPSSIRGTYFFTDENAQFETEIGGEPATVKFLEFRPNGSARIPVEHMRRFLLVMTHGTVDEGGTVDYRSPEGEPTNWAVFSVDHITGRAKTYRP